jgi:hypothetical protein
MGLRPTQGDKKRSCSATTVAGSAALPFVISTGAPKERSGEICGPAVLSWECFSTERRGSGGACGSIGQYHATLIGPVSTAVTSIRG